MTISFDQYPYYPALRTRPAEILGYHHLDSYVKDGLLPLFTLGAWPRQDGLSESIAQMQNAVGGRPFMLDLTKDLTYQNDAVRQLLSEERDFEAWRNLISSIPNAIPVIQLKPSTKIPKLIRQARLFEAAGKKVAFRITDLQYDTPKVTAALASLDTAENGLLIIDVGYIRDAFQAIDIACVDVINDVREDVEDAIIAVISTSFPASVTALSDVEKGGRRGVISILERALHQSLGGSQVCIYGDHGSIHSKVRPLTTGGQYAPRIDYALYDAWVFERRTNCKADGYIECARDLIERYEEILEDDSWGAQMIRNAAEGVIDGMKTPASWIAARVNMHVAKQYLLGTQSSNGDEEEGIEDLL